ncbi:hypothetical protein MHB44_14315 [Lysinibacillus sp. FSL H8-0500]|uniref:hypothetical protein n=1 Tax=Lysinibacillus sp. FSL H8-0500 TaxID=2921393 RepID=UPI0031013BBD
MHVPNFKTNVMYDRATDLLFEVYCDTENLAEAQAMPLRQSALYIVRKITRAIVERNHKMKMKLLNQAKEKIVTLRDESYKMYEEGLIDGYMIDNFAEQLLKLINYQFGKMKKFEEGH